MSRLQEIDEIFTAAEKEDGVDTTQPMLFSFEFVDKDPDKLERLGAMLNAKGFLFVDVFKLGDEETSEPTGEYSVQIDLIAAHSRESLAAVFDEINTDAESLGIAEVDGWEMSELDEDEEDESDDIVEV